MPSRGLVWLASVSHPVDQGFENKGSFSKWLLKRESVPGKWIGYTRKDCSHRVASEDLVCQGLDPFTSKEQEGADPSFSLADCKEVRVRAEDVLVTPAEGLAKQVKGSLSKDSSGLINWEANEKRIH